MRLNRILCAFLVGVSFFTQQSLVGALLPSQAQRLAVPRVDLAFMRRLLDDRAGALETIRGTFCLAHTSKEPGEMLWYHSRQAEIAVYRILLHEGVDCAQNKYSFGAFKGQLRKALAWKLLYRLDFKMYGRELPPTLTFQLNDADLLPLLSFHTVVEQERREMVRDDEVAEDPFLLFFDQDWNYFFEDIARCRAKLSNFNVPRPALCSEDVLIMQALFRVAEDLPGDGLDVALNGVGKITPDILFLREHYAEQNCFAMVEKIDAFLEADEEGAILLEASLACENGPVEAFNTLLFAREPDAKALVEMTKKRQGRGQVVSVSSRGAFGLATGAAAGSAC